ncbi:MAG: hypothetical protein HY909_26075 [Deltaproteobacteria bacterium]|nr:hypothetical protein [Deltaproteobacteria bacterium]
MRSRAPVLALSGLLLGLSPSPARAVGAHSTTQFTTTTDQAPPPPGPGLCCCRVFVHGWQYRWRSAADCQAQGGTCVSPDHC